LVENYCIDADEILLVGVDFYTDGHCSVSLGSHVFEGPLECVFSHDAHLSEILELVEEVVAQVDALLLEFRVTLNQQLLVELNEFLVFVLVVDDRGDLGIYAGVVGQNGGTDGLRLGGGDLHGALLLYLVSIEILGGKLDVLLIGLEKLEEYLQL